MVPCLNDWKQFTILYFKENLQTPRVLLTSVYIGPTFSPCVPRIVKYPVHTGKHATFWVRLWTAMVLTGLNAQYAGFYNSPGFWWVVQNFYVLVYNFLWKICTQNVSFAIGARDSLKKNRKGHGTPLIATLHKPSQESSILGCAKVLHRNYSPYRTLSTAKSLQFLAELKYNTVFTVPAHSSWLSLPNPYTLVRLSCGTEPRLSTSGSLINVYGVV